MEGVNDLPQMPKYRPIAKAGHHTMCPRLSVTQGEVARRAGGGKPHRGYLKRHDLKSAGTLTAALPLRPLRGCLPRVTGEALELCLLLGRVVTGRRADRVRSGSDPPSTACRRRSPW